MQEIYGFHNGLSLGGRQVGGFLFCTFQTAFYHLTSPAKLNRKYNMRGGRKWRKH